MADVGDELLDDLDEAAFDDLDGEQEDALLADDDFESYETSQVIYRETSRSGDTHTEVYQVIDQVHDDEEILEDGVEDDILDIAVGDELDETELESSQSTEQIWTDSSSRNNEDSSKDGSDPVGVSSSTQVHAVVGLSGGGGESDEEDTEGRGSRFRSERTNIISLKGAIGSKNLSEIPDSLDKVRTPLNSGGVLRDRGRGPRGSVRGRLGPHPMRGAMMGRGGPRRGGHHMMPPPQMPPPPPGHKIHVNPHFRGGMHQGPAVWDNERLPPPPGCENFPPGPHNKDMGWGGPMPPHHMGRPPVPPHPGPHGPFPGPHGFPPNHPQGFEDPYHPMEPPQQSPPPNRIVQFNENSQLITVENQHFQRPGYDPNFGPPNNQFQPPPPHFNNNPYPPNQFNPPQRPNFPPQNPYPGPNPSNYSGYPQPDYPPQNPQYQNYEGNWNTQQPGEYYPPQPQPHPPTFNHPQPQFRPPQPTFPNQPPNFRHPPQKQFQNNTRGSLMKRLAPRPPVNPITPPKQMRFEHNKPAVHTRSNLQEIKTVDSLPDTTTKQDPEPEIEEDEETKQYRLKIAEQKALREKILREKEARRLAAALEKQKQQSQAENINSAPASVPVQPVTVPKPVQVQQKPVHVQLQQPVQRIQAQQVRAAGRGRGQTVNRVIPLQATKARVVPRQAGKTNQKDSPNLAKLPSVPQIQLQNIQGTVYKIVKVRTKEGSIVTRKVTKVLYCMRSLATHSLPISLSLPFLQRNKTPIALTQGGVATSANNSATGVTINTNRKVILHQLKSGATSILRGTTTPRLVPTKNAQGRTLFTVQTTPLVNIPKTTPQRLVIDNRPPNTAVKVAAAPDLPDSSLVTIDNLSLSTTQAHIQKMAKQVGTLTSFSYEPEKKKATLRFQKVQEAKEFHNKFNRKMIDLSRILVSVVPE